MKLDSSIFMSKPKRGGPAECGAEAWRERSSEGISKAKRGSAGESWVKPLRCERTYQVHESLSYAALVWVTWTSYSSERGGTVIRGDVEASFFGAMPKYRSLGRCRRIVLRSDAKASSRFEGRIGLEGQSAVKAVAATGRGKPLRASTPGADLAWNKARRTRAEERVKRLRKPEGAAQPGAVLPVLVAALVWRRRRGKNPMEARFAVEPIEGEAVRGSVGASRPSGREKSTVKRSVESSRV